MHPQLHGKGWPHPRVVQAMWRCRGGWAARPADARLRSFPFVCQDWPRQIDGLYLSLANLSAHDTRHAYCNPTHERKFSPRLSGEMGQVLRNPVDGAISSPYTPENPLKAAAGMSL